VVQWRWVVVGALAMGAVHGALTLALKSTGLIQSLELVLFVGALPYLLGGAVMGWRSRVPEVREPFYGAAFAAAVVPVWAELERILARSTPDHLGDVMGQVAAVPLLTAIFCYILGAMGAFHLVQTQGHRLRANKGQSSAAHP
jgi:hypothetical protein